MPMSNRIASTFGCGRPVRIGVSVAVAPAAAEIAGEHNVQGDFDPDCRGIDRRVEALNISSGR